MSPAQVHPGAEVVVHAKASRYDGQHGAVLAEEGPRRGCRVVLDSGAQAHFELSELEVEHADVPPSVEEVAQAFEDSPALLSTVPGDVLAWDGEGCVPIRRAGAPS